MEINLNRANYSTQARPQNMNFKANIQNLVITRGLPKASSSNLQSSLAEMVQNVNKNAFAKEDNEIFQLGDKVVVSSELGKHHLGELVAMGSETLWDSSKRNEVVIRTPENELKGFLFGTIFTEEGLNKLSESVKEKLGLFKK